MRNQNQKSPSVSLHTQNEMQAERSRRTILITVYRNQIKDENSILTSVFIAIVKLERRGREHIHLLIHYSF